MSSVAVIGLGLIGGSLLRALAGPAVGYDADPQVRAAARAAGFVVADTLNGAIAERDVVVVATPIPAVGPVFDAIAASARPDTIVTDVASVKAPVRGLAARALPGLRYVGGHPMAGTERSGWQAADPALFGGAAWVLCLEPDTDVAAWGEIASIVLGLGARVVPATAVEHDDAVARVSHLPHLFAAVLAAGVASRPLARTLAAGSFRDATRVASTRAELTIAMCTANTEALAPVIDAAVRRVSRAGSGDAGAAAALIESGHRARAAMDSAPRPAHRSIAAGDRDGLLALGRDGGWLVARVHTGWLGHLGPPWQHPRTEG
ncbi:MAG: prephenate dehydrogenase [Mycobacteriales bacterium]